MVILREQTIHLQDTNIIAAYQLTTFLKSNRKLLALFYDYTGKLHRKYQINVGNSHVNFMTPTILLNTCLFYQFKENLYTKLTINK